MSPRFLASALGFPAICLAGCAQLLGVDQYEVGLETGDGGQTTPAPTAGGDTKSGSTALDLPSEPFDAGAGLGPAPIGTQGTSAGPPGAGNGAGGSASAGDDGGARTSALSGGEHELLEPPDGGSDARPRCNGAACAVCVTDADCAGNPSGGSCVSSGPFRGTCAACDPADNSGCSWPNGRCDPEARECRSPPSCDGLEPLCAGSSAYTGGYGGAPGWVMSGSGAAAPEQTPESAYEPPPLPPQDCCSSPLVQGGWFNRSNDASFPATVSNFRLDRFEVVVGRFQRFVSAWIGGYRPEAGDGKHAHVHEGRGLVDVDGHGEPGWDPKWSTNLATTAADWDANLSCATDYPTWPSKTAWPQTCVSWYEAYAFCIWDGGFLPSEAEWNYAAAGGTAQRSFPWGDAAPGSDAALAVYGCYYNGSGTCSDVRNIAPVGSITAGDGLFGQSDLAGNVWEWNLDWYATAYSSTCDDCTGPASGDYRVRRGSSFRYDAESLATPLRSSDASMNRRFDVGFRCARAP